MAQDGLDRLAGAALHVAMVVGLMPLSYCIGKGFQRLGLPAITGYMCAGLACGPHMLNIAQPQEVVGMWLVESWCLALIALAAGSELHLSELSEQRKPVLFVATAISVATWLLVFGGFMLFSSVLPLTKFLTLRRTYAMASLTATLMIARSPASCLAILREVDAQGPFSSLVLAVTVISDVLVLVMFSVNLELVVVMYEVQPVGCTHDGCSKVLEGGSFVALMARPLLMLAGAAVLGVSGGWLLLQLTRLRSALPHQPQLRMTLIACATQALSLLAEHFGIEGLLVCLVAGVFAANRPPPTWPSSPRETRDDRMQRARKALHQTLEALLPTCCVVFFTLVGTTLKLSVLMDTAPTACLLAGLRLLAIALGARLGGKLAGCPSEHSRRLWLAMVTQAGVAIGLAKNVSDRIPDWGPDFTALLMAVIVLNQLAGPPMFKAALVSIGEGTADGPTNGNSNNVSPMRKPVHVDATLGVKYTGDNRWF